ncbi:peptidase inhibitor I78 family protein [Pseudomonas duriflava]|uniref:Peptidase inhibitor I78 family protein n=1 Tax=Pseudomonas duriflava TaxID=459528 RepID=A0A562QAE3_9PSED|nr:I78 family peptidase inhibitor [Pseudomonas duriflava]TWI53727.1 peptidase inhibitor I78 family protein [Pseudomonas duriflava]
MFWKIASVTLLISSFMLAGCSTSEPESSGSSARSATGSTLGSGCNSDAAQYVVGKTATPELFKQVQERAGARVARLIRPDDAITMDFNSERLTITTNDSLVIQSARCG